MPAQRVPSRPWCLRGFHPTSLLLQLQVHRPTSSNISVSSTSNNCPPRRRASVRHPRTQPTPLIKSEHPSLQSPQQQQQQQQQQQHQQPPMTPNNPAYAAQMSMQGVVNPIALQGPQPWSNNNGFGTFDEMDLMSSADYTNMSFDDPISSPMFNRQMPLNCIGSTSFLDNTKNDYDDTINQFLNPNPTEITSI